MSNSTVRVDADLEQCVLVLGNVVVIRLMLLPN
jgi:hypothetical protein